MWCKQNVVIVLKLTDLLVVLPLVLAITGGSGSVPAPV